MNKKIWLSDFKTPSQSNVFGSRGGIYIYRYIPLEPNHCSGGKELFTTYQPLNIKAMKKIWSFIKSVCLWFIGKNEKKQSRAAKKVAKHCMCEGYELAKLIWQQYEHDVAESGTEWRQASYFIGLCDRFKVKPSSWSKSTSESYSHAVWRNVKNWLDYQRVDAQSTSYFKLLKVRFTSKDAKYRNNAKRRI